MLLLGSNAIVRTPLMIVNDDHYGHHLLSDERLIRLPSFLKNMSIRLS